MSVSPPHAVLYSAFEYIDVDSALNKRLIIIITKNNNTKKYSGLSVSVDTFQVCYPILPLISQIAITKLENRGFSLSVLCCGEVKP